MAREAAQRSEHHTGLYAEIHARELAEAAACPWPNPGNITRLAALRSGRPVDICVGDLPAWARPGRETHWWHRAIVTATGAIDFYDDTGRRFREEHGL